MNQAAQVECITSGVNEARFLEHLKTMFSTSKTVLAETMQNARRAGASQVAYDYEPETKTLIISDNGCGIADFSALITVAESGWSEETMQSESPFGVGFFSVAFAAKSVVVESRGRAIAFTSDDLIAKRSIPVLPSSFIGGTRLSLQECSLGEAEIKQSLTSFARGFAIPVVWDGEELPRPHAMASLSGISTDVGFVHVPSIHGEQADRDPLYVAHAWVYCQGLPIRAGRHLDGGAYYERDSSPIVHIDHLKYQPRMPDRECLLNQDDVAEQITDVIRTIWVAFMESEKARLPADVFAERFWGVARSIHHLEIMNDVPYLPKETLTVFEDRPIRCGEGESYIRHRELGVSKDIVMSGEVVLAHEFDEYEGEGDEFAKLQYASQSNFIFVSRIHEGHWAHDYALTLQDERAVVSGKVVASEYFSGSYASGTVKVIEDLSVSMFGKRLVLEEPIAVGSDQWGEMTFLVPKGRTSASYVLRQASTYTNDSDNYQETDLGLDSDQFDNLVAILNGEDGQATLTKCLQSAGARSKTNLRNTSYRVSFDADGNITVEAL